MQLLFDLEKGHIDTIDRVRYWSVIVDKVIANAIHFMQFICHPTVV